MIFLSIMVFSVNTTTISPHEPILMETATETQADDLYISQFRFIQNDSGDLTKIPASPDLHGFLVYDSEENIYQQIRLLGSEDPETKEDCEAIWKSIQEQNDCVLFPEILTHGTDDEVLYYVSTLPSGEPIGQFLENGSPLPPSNAVQLISRFAGRLKSQDLIPVTEFAIPSQSLWLDCRSSGPRIILGDIAPRKSLEAEAENVAMCLNLLRDLTGADATELIELCGEIENGPNTLSDLETRLNAYLEANPADTAFWTTENQPRQILRSLVSEKDLAEEITEEAEAEPILELEPELVEIPATRKSTAFRRKPVLIGAAAVATVAAIIAASLATSRDTEGDEILRLPHAVGATETVAPQVEKPVHKEASISLPNHLDTPPAYARAPKMEAVRMEIPFAYSSIIKIPDLKIDEIDLPLSIPPFLSLKSMASVLLPEGEEPGSPPLLSEMEKSKPDVIQTASSLPVVGENTDDVSVTTSTEFHDIQSRIEKKKLVKAGGTGIEAWVIRESGEALLNKPDATEADRSNAFFAFLEAANLGDARAQFLAGECLFQGKGTPKDVSRAVYYLEKAVAQNEHRALDLLGVCLVRGWGIEIDEARAVQLFQAAVDQGNIPAYYNLGARYAQGQGVPRNPSIAADLFQLGAQRGNARCMLIYARCLETGFGRKESRRNAVTWFKKAAAHGDSDAIRWCDNQQIISSNP